MHKIFIYKIFLIKIDILNKILLKNYFKNILYIKNNIKVKN